MESNFNVPLFNPGYVFNSENVNSVYSYSSVTFSSTAISSNNFSYEEDVCSFSSGFSSNATMSSNSSYYQDYVNYYSGFTQPVVDCSMTTPFAQPAQNSAPGYQYNFDVNSTAQKWNLPCYFTTSTIPNLFQTPSPTATPPAQTSQCPEKKCSHCSTTETCRWRNIRSKNGILCNACYAYERESWKAMVRPVEVIEKYKNRKEKKLKSSH